MEFNLADVLAVQSHSYEEQAMIDYIHECVEFLNRDSNEKILVQRDEVTTGLNQKTTNLYLTKGAPPKGGHYPCFVSHTDTVHSIQDNLYIGEGVKQTKETLYGYQVVHSDYGGRFVEPAGCGGDDKVGVWACLNLLAELPVCKVAFFGAEEVGCVGSSAADKDFFKDVAYILQTDRKGNDDFVTKIMGVELSSQSFIQNIQHILKKRGFKTSDGGLTDVYKLKDKFKLDVCVANMSSGYYNPHTDSEYVVIEDAYNTYGLMRDIYLECKYTKQEHKHKYKTYASKFNFKKNNNQPKVNKTDWASRWEKDLEVEDWNRSFNSHHDNTYSHMINDTCPDCGSQLIEHDNIPHCVEEGCISSSVHYPTDDTFYDTNSDAIYPFYNDVGKCVGYWNPFKEKLYTITELNPNQYSIPF